MNTLNIFLCILFIVTGTIASGSKKSTEPCKLKEPNYSKNIATLARMAENITNTSWTTITTSSSNALLVLSVTMENVTNIVKCMTGIGADARKLLLEEVGNVSNEIATMSSTMKQNKTAAINWLKQLQKQALEELEEYHPTGTWGGIFAKPVDPFKINLSDSTTTRALKNGVKKIVDAWYNAKKRWLAAAGKAETQKKVPKQSKAPKTLAEKLKNLPEVFATKYQGDAPQEPSKAFTSKTGV